MTNKGNITIKIQYKRDKYAPIPDYHSTDGRWRIYKAWHSNWRLQDRTSPDHPDPILYAGKMAECKAEAIRLTHIQQGE